MAFFERWRSGVENNIQAWMDSDKGDGPRSWRGWNRGFDGIPDSEEFAFDETIEASRKIMLEPKTVQINVPGKDAKLIEKMVAESQSFENAQICPTIMLPSPGGSSSEVKTGAVFFEGQWQLVHYVKQEPDSSIVSDAAALKEKYKRIGEEYGFIGDDLLSFLDRILSVNNPPKST